MSTTGERRRRGGAVLLRAVGLAALLGAPGVRALEDVPGKVELSTVDIEQLLELPIAAVSRRIESTADAPGAVFVVTGEDLRAMGARTLGEALRTVPGLFTYEDSHWPTLGVRGVGLLADYGTRVLFLVDGHPLGDALGMGRSYVGRDLPIPLAAVRRVEVIKGPVGAVYGPTAFLGVVNVVTQEPGPSGEGVALRGEGTHDGTTGAEADAMIARGAGWGGAVAHAFVHGTRGQDRWFPEWAYEPAYAGDPERPPRAAPPDGIVRGVDTASAAGGYLRVSALGAAGAGACGWFTRRLPAAPYASLVGDRATDLSTLACFARVSVDRPVARGWELGATASFDDFEYRDAYAYAPPPEDVGLYRDVAHDRWVSGEVRARWSAAADGAHLGLGARGAAHWTLMHPYAEGVPTLLQDPDLGAGLGPIRRDFRTLDAWAIGDVAVARTVRLHAGTTLTVNELFGNRLTSKAAVVWRPTAANTVKLVYAEGFRAPTVAEAFYADGSDFVSSPALKPELAQSGEVIVERRVGDVAVLSASAFWNRYRDLIQFVTVGTVAGDRQKAVNAGTRTVRGAEGAVTVRWSDRLQARGGLSVQRTWPGDVPNAPRLVGSAAVSTRHPWRPLRLGVHGAATSRRDKDRTALLDGQRTALPAYLVLGAAATLDVPAIRGLAVEASVSNLLDARVLHPVAGDAEPISELPEHGRTFWLGVRWSR